MDLKFLVDMYEYLDEMKMLVVDIRKKMDC